MPQISVIVPVYRVEDCLKFCVDSILAQTFTDYELILVDDGSPDNCGAICEEYAEKDSRILVIHRENGGLSAARNSGIDIATGEYITFIDSDDAVTVDYLEILLTTLEENNADIAVCKFKEFEDGENPHLNAENSKAGTRLLNGKNTCIEIYSGKLPINAWGKIFKTSLVGNDRFPVGRLHEDQAFIPPICYRAETVAAVESELYMYRVRSESITRTNFSIKRYDDIWAIDNCIRFFEEKNEPDIAEAAKAKRKRLLCVYSIYAKRDEIEIPEEYQIGTISALKYLRKNVSNSKYGYYLAQVNPKLVKVHEYIHKIETVLKVER